MKASIYISLLTIAMLLYGCHSSNKLIIEGQDIPFLSSATPEVIDQIDSADPIDNAHHRIIWKARKSDGVNVQNVIKQGLSRSYGGLILAGFTTEEYTQIRNALDTILDFPKFYGTEEVLLLNRQFADASESVSAIMVAAQNNPKHLAALEDQFTLQHNILGVNLSASIYNRNYEANGEDWEAPYDFNHGDPSFYQKRIKRLNQNRTLSVLNSFDQEIPIAVDSTSNLDSLYYFSKSLSAVGLSAIIVDSNLINAPQTEIKNFFKSIIGFQGILMSEISNTENLKYALDAGIDLLIIDNPNIQEYYKRLKKHLDETLLSAEELESLQKVLLAKLWMQTESESQSESLATWFTVTGMDKIEDESTILPNNYKNLLPFTHTFQRDFRLLSYGPSPLEEFEQTFKRFANFKRNFYNTKVDSELTALNLARYRFATIIITLDSVSIDLQKDSAFIHFVNDMSSTRKVALVNFGNPNNLIHFDSTVTQLQLFNRSKRSENLAAHILFGGDIAKGSLPIQLNNFLQKKKRTLTPITRWKYVDADELGIDVFELNKIEKIAQEGIRKKAFPGCQIFVVKDGKVIYDQAFGHHTYNRKKSLPVRKTDLYDIASVTKVAATTISLMKLYENGAFRLNDRLDKHLDIEKDKQIAKVKIQDLLIHQSGIQAYMPLGFIIKHKDAQKSKTGLYRADTIHPDYPIKVAQNVFYSSRMLDSLWNHVVKLSADKKKYRYSDVNMFLLQKLIEAKTATSLDEYTFKKFYRQLGLRNTSYVPLKRFSNNQIVPTEEDKKWRGQILDGYVHDPTAALLGGVSGNAGLFSNAHDLAVIGQMLLNGGTYGGRKYFDPETVNLFTSSKFSANRGLGFDSNNNGSAKVGKLASHKTYGHLGFTGTALWVDPEENLVYVFLSNRVHPRINNNQITKRRYRQRIHDTIYKAIENGKLRVESASIRQTIAGGDG